MTSDLKNLDPPASKGALVSATPLTSDQIWSSGIQFGKSSVVHILSSCAPWVTNFRRGLACSNLMEAIGSSRMDVEAASMGVNVEVVKRLKAARGHAGN